jgi:ribosomal protein L3 glutamine methyltransferase
VTPEEEAQVAALLDARISTRKPAAYLTNEAWLMGLPFYVDERVIIPRSLIAELLADASIDPWLGEDTRRVLDLCTGNGSLAVLAAITYPDVRVEAADISLDALAVARINVDRHHLDSRITLIESDGLAACAGPYDLILCNPPYVNAASMAALPPEFRAEPGLALAGGADGMDFIRDLLQNAARHMSENAVLVLEIGNERENFERAFPTLEPLWFETSSGADQVLLLTREQLA